jgi:hypothetical protein
VDELDRRISLLTDWANRISQAALSGALAGGRKPDSLAIHAVETVRGPRAGALEIHAGLDAGRLLRLLSANDYALHRQFVPWPFAGRPAVYMSGRYVRLEAGWPDALAEKNIKLSDIGQYPHGGGRWIAGKNEHGATITLGLSDTVPHYLLAGRTGSGKTFAMRAAVAQLARDPDNALVLIDGKWGYGLSPLAHVRRAGPLATNGDMDVVRGALGWAVGEMRRRYEERGWTGRVIVAVDEIQEIAKDPPVVDMLRRLAAQGRDADVHLIVGTQDPTAAAFSDVTIRRNLVGRLALHVEGYKASEVVVGGASPRADWLLGAGDAYAIVPGGVHRAQLAYLPPDELALVEAGPAALDAWPEYDPEAGGTLPAGGGREVSGAEVAVSLVQAHLGSGRPSLVRALDNAGLGRPGSDRADWLLGLGREARAWLAENDWTLCET